MASLDGFIKACMEGDVVLARAALEAGLSPNLEADVEYGTKPLHWAADNGHATVIGLLIEGRADIHAVDKQGNTALHAAACNGDAAAISTLLSSRADVAAADSNRWTVLHAAACCGHRAAIAALIEAGADVRARDIQEGTPLHVAGHYRQPASIRALLEAKADPAAKNNEDKTPLFLARFSDVPSEHEDASVALLEEAQAAARQKLAALGQRLEEKKRSQERGWLRSLPALICCRD
ncbi:unnamed protein product [Polarella glacialis]|uniref:Uncharacterized protein n=1 Tax=Polarella glacialis TaxID=89957 RepID=A0A813DE61_POLGL|nr:unnamed protein product [Polarella glacialis]